MSWIDRLKTSLAKTPPAAGDIGSIAGIPEGHPARWAFNEVQKRIDKSGGTGAEKMVAEVIKSYFEQGQGGGYMLKSAIPPAPESARSGYIGINDYGFKGKRQYIADRRYLLDLYVIANNNADVRTAVTHLRNEIFRRGLEWEPAFELKCPDCDTEYGLADAEEQEMRCKNPLRNEEGELVLDEQHNKVYPKLIPPDEEQRQYFEPFLQRCNYFGQSLENILREIEDDINTVDDGFLYVAKSYYAIPQEEEDGGGFRLHAKPEMLFRLDPVLVEFDLDQRGVPGQRHHACVLHRDNLLEVPAGEGWEYDWKGVCPVPDCNLPTKPILYKFNESYLQGGYGAAQSKVLYLFEDEVIHWSRYTPSELYGYPPLLSIYEKALTLIGMDRYLYDYFYERRVPQGIITTVTDDVQGLESRKSEVQARMAQDPHYIPWLAVNSKTGQGRTEFVRFAYSLDELNYLPVRDEIRERIAGIYGVSQLWMSSSSGIGGLNSESVPGDTPVWIRRDKKFLDCVPIAALDQATGRKDRRFEDVEALTPNGWSAIRNVWRHMTDKPIYTLRTGDAVLRVTGKHSIFANGEKKAADEVAVGDQLELVAPPIETETTLTYELAWLLGFFAAEGQVTQDRVSFSNGNRDLLRQAQSMLERVYGKKAALYEALHRSAGTVEMQDRSIAKWFLDEATATYRVSHVEWQKGHNRTAREDQTHSFKKVPALILNAPKEFMKSFLDGYTVGDGHVYVNSTISQQTTDYVLAAGLHFIYQRLGYSTRTNWRRNENENQNDVFEMSTLVEGEAGRRKGRDIVDKVHVQDDWHDYVYDIEVEDECHAFVAGVGGVRAENSQQLVVMSRVVEGAQRSYHTDVFPKLLEAFGITDWQLQLAVPEEQSELMRLQILQQRLTFAQGMGQLGFGVKWDADTETFTYSGEVEPGSAQGMPGEEGGGMEDLFGGGGGQQGGM